MTLRARNRLITFSMLAGPFIFLFCLLLFWEAEPLPPIPPLPNPNGYEKLVRAGSMIDGNIGYFDTMREAELSALVRSNSNALQMGLTGLDEKCQVTLEYSITLSAHLSQLTAVKLLAQAFAAQGRIAEMEKRPADAAQCDLHLFRLANASARGGVVIDQLVGIAIEALGVEQLKRLVDQLDAKSCRKTAAALETLDSQRQTWSEVMQQERDWSRRTFPGIRYEITRLTMRKSLDKALLKAEQKFEAQQIKTRQLMVDFASHAYELDKGHPPVNLADLVPDYLEAIPQDPLTGTNMVYSPR